ncbi:hypothetical protein KC318_g11967 [Hortaea werneckii]|nr:hypothetical protein KC334_g5155 [Hortaea werneckii]KAI6967525.1 hypothetical protein KC355_g12054 [Hortaea werneckii]KAI7657154.1 hypothetical protein KC318_g11967 [Hortaea werneckii]
MPTQDDEEHLDSNDVSLPLDSRGIIRRTITGVSSRISSRGAHTPAILEPQFNVTAVNYTNQVNIFIDPTLIISGSSCGGFGVSPDLNMPTSVGELQRPRLTPNGIRDSDQPSLKDAHTTLHSQSSSRELRSNRPPPDHYFDQPYDWWTPGRYFSVWAVNEDGEDVEIHDKSFILLDSKGSQGLGVLVTSLEGEQRGQVEHSSSARRALMLLMNHPDYDTIADAEQTTRLLAASEENFEAIEKKLDKLRLSSDSDLRVSPGTLVQLQHTYNIPFAKYKCRDPHVPKKLSPPFHPSCS